MRYYWYIIPPNCHQIKGNMRFLIMFPPRNDDLPSKLWVPYVQTNLYVIIMDTNGWLSAAMLNYEQHRKMQKSNCCFVSESFIIFNPTMLEDFNLHWNYFIDDSSMKVVLHSQHIWLKQVIRIEVKRLWVEQKFSGSGWVHFFYSQVNLLQMQVPLSNESHPEVATASSRIAWQLGTG